MSRRCGHTYTFTTIRLLDALGIMTQYEESESTRKLFSLLTHDDDQGLGVGR